jgi:hypothetical protein
MATRAYSATQPPMYTYKVIANLSGKLRTLQYAIASDKSILSSPASLLKFDLSKADTVKACTLQSSKKILYYGTYAGQKLHFLRISWSTSTSTTSFFKIAINLCYMSIRKSHDMTIAAEARWTSLLGFHIEWSAHYRYLKDSILNNHSREFLYKIVTRACMTGTRVQFKFGHSKICPHCHLEEDEFHLFVQCEYIQPAWRWLIGKSLACRAYAGLEPA